MRAVAGVVVVDGVDVGVAMQVVAAMDASTVVRKGIGPLSVKSPGPGGAGVAVVVVAVVVVVAGGEAGGGGEVGAGVGVPAMPIRRVTVGMGTAAASLMHRQNSAGVLVPQKDGIVIAPSVHIATSRLLVSQP